MRILGLTTSYPRTPADDSSIFVHRLYSAIAKGASITVAAPTETAKESEERRDGVVIKWIRYLPLLSPRLIYGAGLLPNLKQNPWRIFELPLLIFRLAVFGLTHGSEYEVIHANWILPGLSAWIVKLLIGKPYVITLRGSDTMLFKVAPVRWISALPLRCASSVTVVSEQMHRETIAAFPHIAAKCRCIENGVEQPESAQVEVSELPEKFLAVVGTVIPRKRLESAIELISKEPLKDFALVICGKTEEPQYLAKLKTLATELKVTQRVHFLGSVSPDAVWTVLKKAAGFLACSEYEGRPNAVLEALSAGTIVFASTIAAHSAILEDERNAILFDTANPDAAATRISAVLGDETRKSLIIEQGKSLVAGASWKKAATQYLEIFSAAVKPH